MNKIFPDDYRNAVIVALGQELKSNSEVDAVWLGGSAATGGLDEFSDIDINILTRGVTSAFSAVIKALSRLGPICHTWNEPKSIWPDLTQKIFFLENSPPSFFVDVAVFPTEAEELLKEFMIVERHGNPRILFDKHNLLQIQHGDPTLLRLKHRKRVNEIEQSFPVYRRTAEKELVRGNTIDALAYYNALLRPVIELLGIVYRPFRSDFGFRYLKKDLPLEIYGELQRLMYVSSPEDLRNKLNKLGEVYSNLILQLKCEFESNDGK